MNITHNEKRTKDPMQVITQKKVKLKAKKKQILLQLLTEMQ